MVKSMNRQRGFIGTIVFLLFLIGLIVILFAGRVFYNNYKDQSEIFSFSAFDHTFRMTQEKSMKAKVKDVLNKTIDGVSEAVKETDKAIEEVAKERGLTTENIRKEANRVAKDAGEVANNAVNDVKKEVPNAQKNAEELGGNAVDAVGGFFKGVGNKIDEYKRN